MALESLTNPSTIAVQYAIELIRAELAKPEQDTHCKHCDGKGCVACDARCLPKPDLPRAFREVLIGDNYILRFYPSDTGWMCGISNEMMDAIEEVTK